MKTAKELVDQINAAEVCAPHEIEDVIDMDDVKEVVTLNRAEYRWYVIGTAVFSIGTEFFGVRGPATWRA
jgi:hypothetical protein